MKFKNVECVNNNNKLHWNINRVSHRDKMERQFVIRNIAQDLFEAHIV